MNGVIINHGKYYINTAHISAIITSSRKVTILLNNGKMLEYLMRDPAKFASWIASKMAHNAAHSICRYEDNDENNS